MARRAHALGARQRRRTQGSGSVYQRKDGLWVGALHIGYDDKGKRKRLPPVYGRTQKIAEDKLHDLRELHKKGKVHTGSSVSTGAYLEEWLKSSRAMHEPSWYFRRDKVRLIQRTPLAKIPLRKLTKGDVIEMANVQLLELRDEDAPEDNPAAVEDDAEEEEEPRPLSWTTRKHCKDVLRKALFDAIATGKLPADTANPASRITLLGKSKFKPTIMPDLATVERFVRAAMKDNYFALFILALFAGLRQGELLGLRWQDINLQTGVISVRRQAARYRGRKMPKGKARGTAANLFLGGLKTEGSSRTFKLPARCQRALVTHLQRQMAFRKLPTTPSTWNPHNLVFPASTGYLMQASWLIQNHFHTLIVNAGLTYATRTTEGYRFHDLRHTCATLLLLAGVQPKVVMQRMGWTTLAMADRYQHLLPQMGDEATAKLDALLP